MQPVRAIRILAGSLSIAGLAAMAPDNPAARGTVHFGVALQARSILASEHAVTGSSPFSATCGDRAGTLYVGAEVEPHIAVDPLNASHLLGTWQQDRYSNGGSRGQAFG